MSDYISARRVNAMNRNYDKKSTQNLKKAASSRPPSDATPLQDAKAAKKDHNNNDSH
jgi:hypothetical protein